MTRPFSALWNRVSSTAKSIRGSRPRVRKQRHTSRVRRAFLELLEERRVLAINVAVVGDISGGDQAGFISTRDQLNNDTYFDFNATLVHSTQVDTPFELSAYDVVIVSNNGFAGTDAFSNLAFTAALRNWVETQGGGAVMTGFGILGAGNTSPPANLDIDAIIPVNTSGSYAGTHNTGTVISNSPHLVTQGISSLFVAQYTQLPATAPLVDAGAITLGTSGGGPAIVVGAAGTGRGVYLGPNYTGTSSYLTSDLRSGAADRLLEQAVAWAAQETSYSLTVTTSGSGSGTITSSPAGINIP